MLLIAARHLLLMAALIIALLTVAPTTANAVSRMTTKECKDALRGDFYQSADMPVSEKSDNDIRHYMNVNGFQRWAWDRNSLGNVAVTRWDRYRISVWIDFWYYPDGDDPNQMTAGNCVRTASGRLNDRVALAPFGW